MLSSADIFHSWAKTSYEHRVGQHHPAMEHVGQMETSTMLDHVGKRVQPGKDCVQFVMSGGMVWFLLFVQGCLQVVILAGLSQPLLVYQMPDLYFHG